jgi:hypothetical protein
MPNTAKKKTPIGPSFIASDALACHGGGALDRSDGELLCVAEAHEIERTSENHQFVPRIQLAVGGLGQCCFWSEQPSALYRFVEMSGSREPPKSLGCALRVHSRITERRTLRR